MPNCQFPGCMKPGQEYTWKDGHKFCACLEHWIDFLCGYLNRPERRNVTSKKEGL